MFHSAVSVVFLASLFGPYIRTRGTRLRLDVPNARHYPPTRAFDCNRSAMAELDAMKG
jgi:hypothetical protein